MPSLRTTTVEAARGPLRSLRKIRRLLTLDDDGHHVRIWALAREARLEDTDLQFVEQLVHYLRQCLLADTKVQTPRLLREGAAVSARFTGWENWIVEGLGWQAPLPERAARGPVL